MDSFSLNYLLKDLKKLDKDDLFEKVKQLYYENQKQSNKILDLEAELAEVKSKVRQKEPKESKTPNYEGFNTQWVMAEKIVFILKQNKKPMTTKEIVNTLLSIEPKLNDAYSEKEKILSNFVYNTLKCGFIERIEKSIGGGYKYVINKKDNN